MNDGLWTMDDELWMTNSGEQLIAFGREGFVNKGFDCKVHCLLSIVHRK